MLHKQLFPVLFAPDDESGEDVQSSKYKPESVEDALKIIAALEKRVNEKKTSADAEKAQRLALEERLAAIEAAQRQRLEETGNYQELARQRQAEAEALKPFAERAKALEAVIREGNEARIASIPETMRGLIPADYAPEKLQTWLNANWAMLSRQAAPNFDAGAGASGGSSPVVLSAEEKAIARKTGMTDEQYIQYKKRVTGG